MAFAGILDRIRTKKKANVVSAQVQYYQLVKKVSEGHEVDVDEAAEVIEANGKSEDAFESDVKLMEKRYEWEAFRTTRINLEKQIPGLTKKLQAAQLALDEAVNRLRPQIDAAWTQLNDVQNQQLSLVYTDQRLIETCLDQSLLARESELSAQRKELLQKLSPLTEDLRIAKAYRQTIHAYIDGLNDTREKNITYKPAILQVNKDMKVRLAELERQEDIIRQLESAVKEFEDQVAPINRELDAIQSQKLVP